MCDHCLTEIFLSVEVIKDSFSIGTNIPQSDRLLYLA